MGYNGTVLHRGDVGDAVAVAVVEIGAGLVVVLHEIGERQVAYAVLHHDPGRCEGSVFPCTLLGRDIETGAVVPTVVVAVVIHIPRVEGVGAQWFSVETSSMPYVA